MKDNIFELPRIRYEDISHHHRLHHQAAVKTKPEKNSALNGIQTQDLCEYQCSNVLPTELSSQLGNGTVHIVRFQYTVPKDGELCILSQIV